jgi:hypothetical protein
MFIYIYIYIYTELVFKVLRFIFHVRYQGLIWRVFHPQDIFIFTTDSILYGVNTIELADTIVTRELPDDGSEDCLRSFRY